MSIVSQFPTHDKGPAPLSTPNQKVLKETVLEYLKVYGYEKILSESEARQFIQTALSGNLDPFKREIYLAVYGEGDNRKVSILTGYQVYLKRAEQTRNLDGWKVWIEGEAEQMKALVEIFRKDWSHSFTHEVYWQEAVQKKKDGYPSSFWTKQPRFQLKKVAIAQAFRLAFPDELGSLPYESAELPDTSTPDIAPMVPNSAEGGVKMSNPNPVKSLAEQALVDTDTISETPIPEAGKAQDTYSNQQGSDPGTESRDSLLKKIEDLFDDHPEDFTERHMNWILDKVRTSPDIAGAKKMVAYTEKVIRRGISA